MEEFTVLKQGAYKAGNWTSRVLSIHSALGVAAITAQDKPEETLQHQCIYVTSAQIWPQFKETHIKEPPQTMEAKLTIRVKGIPAKIGVREEQGAAGPTRIYRYTKKDPDASKFTWMVRFDTYEKFEKAVRLFQAMKPADDNSSAAGRSLTERPPKEAAQGGALVEGLEVEGAVPHSMIPGNLDEELAPIRAQWQRSNTTDAGYAQL